MSRFIEDGKGNGFKLEINSRNKAEVSSVNRTEYENAVIEGKAFNINTEIFTITGTSESACLYVKNNEEEDIYITGLFAYSDFEILLRAYIEPSGGTIVSTADQINITNRKVGNSETFIFDAYKGFDGATVTGQNPTPLLYQVQNNRVFGNVNIAIPRGGSIAITLQPSAGNTGDVNVYCGFVGYKIEV